eukprot:20003-Heterococcus_DN1.PRE.8
MKQAQFPVQRLFAPCYRAAMYNMDVAAKRTRASDETCVGALRIVAREGWLSKAAWRISRAVHAFAKPTRALLSGNMDDAMASAVLARPLITALRLRGEFGSTTPLPACLKELELSEYCGALQELPSSLTSLFASDWRGATGRGRRPRADELEGVQCPAGVTELSLKSVGWHMKLPSQLQMLTLRYCVLKTELRLPDTLRRATFSHCSIRDQLVLNEGLLCLELQGNTQCRTLLQLPSTLEVLIMDDSSDAPLAQPLPAHLEMLVLGDSFDAPLGPLPERLEELSLGTSFSEPLGPLPASLRILNMSEAEFDHPLGELPWQLRCVSCGCHQASISR